MLLSYLFPFISFFIEIKSILACLTLSLIQTTCYICANGIDPDQTAPFLAKV